MRQLSRTDRATVVAALVEGNSIRGTVRLTGIAKNTIVKLLAELGHACAAFHNEHVRNLRAQRIQCDEIWSFVGAKAKNVRPEQKAALGWGDVWTWTAIDADTKLIVSWSLGPRDATTARWFMLDLTSRLITRVQLTTDSHRVYLNAIENAFESEIDYAQLVKIYGADREGATRYSPAAFVAARREAITGNPDPKHISTSYVERHNLTMRMSMRRFTRLTNGFSKKASNHAAMVSLYFVYYNFCRVHQTLRVTPAMEARLADHVWSVGELVGLLQQSERNNRVA